MNRSIRLFEKAQKPQNSKLKFERFQCLKSIDSVIRLDGPVPSKLTDFALNRHESYAVIPLELLSPTKFKFVQKPNLLISIGEKDFDDSPQANQIDDHLHLNEAVRHVKIDLGEMLKNLVGIPEFIFKTSNNLEGIEIKESIINDHKKFTIEGKSKLILKPNVKSLQVQVNCLFELFNMPNTFGSSSSSYGRHFTNL
ncbi:hypothetical protein FGO68_gene16060 [Halteria grandinella]|uniref:Uncharacterized protein n=1 Tax=Halteria grandinella TaxID=5974 RepID=A0A8J8NXX9_HALGN|nr:hypothetical protein FGO68_gene16060 [Halteria grandinella]